MGSDRGVTQWAGRRTSVRGFPARSIGLAGSVSCAFQTRLANQIECDKHVGFEPLRSSDGGSTPPASIRLRRKTATANLFALRIHTSGEAHAPMLAKANARRSPASHGNAALSPRILLHSTVGIAPSEGGWWRATCYEQSVHRALCLADGSRGLDRICARQGDSRQRAQVSNSSGTLGTQPPSD